jgi:hypothetical protein
MLAKHESQRADTYEPAWLSLDNLSTLPKASLKSYWAAYGLHEAFPG